VCGRSPASTAAILEGLVLRSGTHEDAVANDIVMRDGADFGRLGSKKSRLFRSETIPPRENSACAQSPASEGVPAQKIKKEPQPLITTQAIRFPLCSFMSLLTSCSGLSLAALGTMGNSRNTISFHCLLLLCAARLSTTSVHKIYVSVKDCQLSIAHEKRKKIIPHDWSISYVGRSPRKYWRTIRTAVRSPERSVPEQGASNR
jgi:hypothetical protein